MEITQKEQEAWRAGIDAGREIERQNAAQAQPEPLRYGHDRDDNYVTGWNDCVAALRSEQPVSGDDGLQARTDALYIALEVCSAELFAQCADQPRAMRYVEQARHALALEQCARAAAGRPAQIQPQPSGNAGELPTERADFDAWWPTVGQTIGEVAAWKAWQARAALATQASGQDREDAAPAEWMADDGRAPWAINSLKERIKEMRAAEKRCRNAFRKDYMRDVSVYFADALGDSAEALEKRLAVINAARAKAKGE